MKLKEGIESRMLVKVLSTVIFFILLFSITSAIAGVTDEVEEKEEKSLETAGMFSIDKNTKERLSLSMRCAEPMINEITVEGRIYTLLSTPEIEHTTTPGKPMLPHTSSTVAVPNLDVDLKITGTDYYEIDTGKIYPAQNPHPDSLDDYQDEFVIDEDLYSTDEFYPENAASINYKGNLRGIPFVQLGFYPVSYNPVKGIARVYTDVDIELTWDNTKTFNMDERLKSRHFESYYSNVFSNWAGFETNYEDELTARSKTTRGPSGCEYLIITDPLFIDAANTLANWKLERGIDTNVVDTTETGNTSSEIASYIRDAYNTWTPAPSYVLLLGDAENIATNYNNTHPYHGTATGTDLWYYTLDGSDYYPDMFYGRIPVDTQFDADNFIGKIVDYEVDPPYNSNYYRNVSVAAYFQDPGGDGYEDRRFVRTAEEIRDNLHNFTYYNVSRIYCTDASIDPTNYNDGTYANGQPLPADLLRSNGFAWDGDAADIKSHIDNGSFILQHRDHGAREGWGDPYFMIDEINSLDNGDLLPIVYSVNCQTGWFDHETDDSSDGTSTESFCEEFIRKEQGGCVCAFGATRVSYSGYNDYLTKGWYDALWPEFDPSLGSSTPMYTVGEICNYGKSYMADTWGDSWGYEELEFEIFHVLGDPTMEVWTEEPGTMTVSHPSSYPSGTTQVVVNVSEDDAFVSLVQDGQIIGTNHSSGGQAIINVNPLVGGIVNVTATKHNFRPYRGSIIVPSGDHDIAVKNLNVPSNNVAGDPINVDADIYNMGTSDETNVEIQLKVDGAIENTTTIASILSGDIEPVTLSWAPTFGGDYFVEMYAVPVADENITWNNVKNDTAHVTAYPDIWVDPKGFDFSLVKGDIGTDTLTIYNDGLADLDYEITTLQGGETVFDDFPTSGTFDSNIWDTAGLSGTPEVDDVGVSEPSEPYSMRLNGDGDTVPSVVYDTTTSDTIDFSFYYELGGGGEAPDSGDSLTLEYYTSSGTWTEAWSTAGDGTLHSTYDYTEFSITNADAYHANFQYRFVSVGSGSGYDDFFVDDITFDYSVPITDGWLQCDPYNGTTSPLSSGTVDVTVDSGTLDPGYHQENITIASNDPDTDIILVPVNVTVLSAGHDISVTDMTVEGPDEAGHTHWVNGTVLNQGQNDETNIEVQFLVDGVLEDSTIIASLLSSQQDTVHFTWIPSLAGNYTLTLYAVPVTNENSTSDNWYNKSKEIFANPNIVTTPSSFEFAMPTNSTDTDTLTIENDGLAPLDWEIAVSGPQGVVINEFYGGDPDSVELYNYGPAVDMSGWRWYWQDERGYWGNYTIPAGFTLGSQSFVIIDESSGTNNQTHLFMNSNMMWSPGSSGGMAGGLYDASNNPVDYFRTSGSTDPPPTGHWYAPDISGMTSTYDVGYRNCDQDTNCGDDWTASSTYSKLALNPGQTGVSGATASWLSVSPTNGTTDALSEDYSTLTVDTSGLTNGFYRTNLTVLTNDPDPGQDNFKIPVNLTVTDLTSTQLSLSSGWEFVSSQIVPDDTSIVNILEDGTNGISGSYDKVMYYDATNKEWRTYVPGRSSHFNDLDIWDEDMGLWLHMTGADTLTIEGYQPTTTAITLQPGWNMVGYPSATDQLASNTLPAEVTKIGVFNGAMQYNVEYISDLSTYTMTAGEGYWVYNGADYGVQWNVDY
ncbi:MAG: C25 family cysteine peptidase [Thermoplasmata archaeon]